MMKGSFDATQFITFDMEKDPEIINIISNFRSIGFTIVPLEKIKKVKREYFKDYFSSIAFELKSDDFFRNFNKWKDKANVPNIMRDFADILTEMAVHSKITNFKVILCSYAEKGDSTDEIIKIDHEHILEGLFFMSVNNFEVLTDNLILEIV